MNETDVTFLSNLFDSLEKPTELTRIPLDISGYLATTSLSTRSQRLYEATLLTFSGELEDGGANLRQWLHGPLEGGGSPANSTIGVRFAAMRGYTLWAFGEDYTRHIPRPKRDVYEPPQASIEELQKYLGAFPKTHAGRRNRKVALFVAVTGLRRTAVIDALPEVFEKVSAQAVYIALGKASSKSKISTRLTFRNLRHLTGWLLRTLNWSSEDIAAALGLKLPTPYQMKSKGQPEAIEEIRSFLRGQGLL